jgi:hypothetical protein
MAKKKPPRKRPGRELARAQAPLVQPSADRLLHDIRGLIEQARQQVARTVNSAMVGLYWSIGKRIREDILHEKRAEYGEQIVATLSQQLSVEHGRGYTEKGLRRMIQFAERFPDAQIVATLSRQLGWSHFVEIIPLDDPLKRDFYAEMCRIERWSVRTLRQKIDRWAWSCAPARPKGTSACCGWKKAASAQPSTSPNFRRARSWRGSSMMRSAWPASGLRGRRRSSPGRQACRHPAGQTAQNARNGRATDN